MSRKMLDEEKESLMDPQNPYYDELRSIIDNVSWDNPVSDLLFMNRYLVFLLDNLVLCQNLQSPLKSTFIICGAKLKELPEQESTETFCDSPISSPAGNPLLVQFETLFCSLPGNKHSVSVLQQLNVKYDLYPLSASTGKQLLFMFSKFENKYKLPYISICLGNTTGQLILFGAGGKNNAFHLKLLTQGKVSSLESLPSIKDLTASHLEGFPPASSIETSVCAIYKFLGDESDNSDLTPVKGAHLSVECTWSTVQAILEPLPIECFCIVKLKAAAGEYESGAFLRYKEIKLIKALELSLKNDMTGINSNTLQETNEFENSEKWIGSKSLDLVLQEINELVEDENKKSDYQEYLKLPKENDLENVIASERMCLTLPDKLWLILKNCSSFEDLQKAILHIYEVLGQLNIKSQLVHNSNLSTISKDITSMFNKTNNCKELNKRRATELLLEIGVEKIRRDFYEYFVRHGFIEQDLFNLFTHPELLSPTAVTCLEKLHSVLELTIVCIKQLKLPRSILKEFIRNALEMYATVSEIDLEHVFTFHVPTHDIHPIINVMRPVVWALSLKSEDQNYMKRSYHQFITAATPNHIYVPKKMDPTLMLKGTSYLYCTGTFINENVLLNDSEIQ